MKLSFGLLFVVLALICSAILVASGGSIGLTIQFLLSKLTYSTSNAAALFMLAMNIIGTLVLVINPHPSRLSNIALITLPIILIVGFILHGFATAYYLIHFELPLGPYFLHWMDGANSYTSPFHSHLGKVAIDFAAELFRLRTNSNQYDMGTVFRGVVGDSFAVALASCFFFGGFAAVIALPTINKRYAGYRALAILYICCSAAALKNVLDGGFLAQPAPVVCVMIAFLSQAKNTAHLRSLLKKYWPLGFIVIEIELLPLIISSVEEPLPNLTELLSAVAIVVLVLALSLNQKAGKLEWLAGLYLLAVITIDARLNLLPLLQPLKLDEKILQVETAKALHFSSETPAYKLYRELGDSAVKTRWLLVGKNQRQGSRELLFFIKPLAISGSTGSFNITPAFSEISMKRLTGLQDWVMLYARMRDDLPPARINGIGDVISRNNAYVYTHAIARILTNGGFTEFIMMPATGTNPIPPKFLAVQAK